MRQGVQVSRLWQVEERGVGMKRSIPFRGTVALMALAFVSVAAPLPLAQPVAAADECLCAGGEYHPLTPVRIYDSRPPGINDVANRHRAHREIQR